jgi:glycosyltransferase involved in cell wall biosynthesis
MTEMNNEQPAPTRITLTVIIPTFNRAPLLRLALEALTRQERSPDEVIVVDNNSSDNTQAVVREFESRLPLKYLVETQRGAAEARNLGIRHATGDVLAFTDDDCVPDAKWLRFIELSFLRDPAIGMVAGKVVPCPDPRTWAERFASSNHRVCEGVIP